MTDSINFDNVNFAGFDDYVIDWIKEECVRFSHFKFIDGFQNKNELISIDGSVFGPTNNNMYFLFPIKNGFSVQVIPKHRNSICYEFGIYIYQEDDGVLKFVPYHNAHGPFTSK